MRVFLMLRHHLVNKSVENDRQTYLSLNYNWYSAISIFKDLVSITLQQL